jgi:hypothetical protein
VGKPEGKRTLRILRRRLEDNIKRELHEIELECGLDYLAKNRHM